MKLLLDTDALLWAATAPGELSPLAREAIEAGANSVLVSAVTCWEIAIKQSLGKLELSRPAELWVPEAPSPDLHFVRASFAMRGRRPSALAS